MSSNSEILYRHIGRLIETMPPFDNQGFFSIEQHQWLGRADALVMQGGDISDKASWRATLPRLQTASRLWALEELRNILYRVMAAAELKSPASAQGAFIPVGNTFDAFASLSKLLSNAKNDVLIVDPYMDESALTDFGCTVPENVSLRLMSDQASYKPSLQPAAVKWVEQYGAFRPLNVRLAPLKTLHDRAIFIDKNEAWTLTQSLKDFAKRSPAEIVRANDIANIKIESYEQVWDSAQIII